jgi:hypothetical protein
MGFWVRFAPACGENGGWDASQPGIVRERFLMNGRMMDMTSPFRWR